MQKARKLITPLSKLTIFHMCTFRSSLFHPPILSGLEELQKNTTKLSQWSPNSFSTNGIIKILAPVTLVLLPFFSISCPTSITRGFRASHHTTTTTMVLRLQASLHWPYRSSLPGQQTLTSKDAATWWLADCSVTSDISYLAQVYSESILTERCYSRTHKVSKN